MMAGGWLHTCLTCGLLASCSSRCVVVACRRGAMTVLAHGRDDSTMTLERDARTWHDERSLSLAQAIRLDPYCADAHLNLGVAMRHRGLCDKAISKCVARSLARSTSSHSNKNHHHRRPFSINPPASPSHAGALGALTALPSSAHERNRRSGRVSRARRARTDAPKSAA